MEYYCFHRFHKSLYLHCNTRHLFPTPFPNTIASAEITATSTVANQWEVLTFDFAGISTDIDFTNVVLIMDNGTEGDGSDNYTIYVDDIDIN